MPVLTTTAKFTNVGREMERGEALIPEPETRVCHFSQIERDANRRHTRGSEETSARDPIVTCSPHDLPSTWTFSPTSNRLVRARLDKVRIRGGEGVERSLPKIFRLTYRVTVLAPGMS